MEFKKKRLMLDDRKDVPTYYAKNNIGFGRTLPHKRTGARVLHVGI